MKETRDGRKVSDRTKVGKGRTRGERFDERENLQSQSLNQDRSILSTETFDDLEESMLRSDSGSIWVVFGDGSSDFEK